MHRLRQQKKCILHQNAVSNLGFCAQNKKIKTKIKIGHYQNKSFFIN